MKKFKEEELDKDMFTVKQNHVSFFNNTPLLSFIGPLYLVWPSVFSIGILNSRLHKCSDRKGFKKQKQKTKERNIIKSNSCRLLVFLVQGFLGNVFDYHAQAT